MTGSAAANDVVTVSTTDDVVDAEDGVLSLSEAVVMANVAAGADTLALDSNGDYVLDADCRDLTPPDVAELHVTDTAGLTIEGNGATVTQSAVGEPYNACEDRSSPTTPGLSPFATSPSPAVRPLRCARTTPGAAASCRALGRRRRCALRRAAGARPRDRHRKRSRPARRQGVIGLVGDGDGLQRHRERRRDGWRSPRRRHGDPGADDRHRQPGPPLGRPPEGFIYGGEGGGIWSDHVVVERPLVHANVIDFVYPAATASAPEGAATSAA